MSVREIAENLTYDLSVTIGGVDVSPYVVSFGFLENLGQKATAELVLAEKGSNGLLVRPSRWGPDGGSQPLHPHNLTRTNKVLVNLETCGMPSEYPAFLIDDVDFSPDGVCTLGLSDYHTLLEQDGVNDTDIMAEAGSTTTSRQAVAQMASDAGLLCTTDITDHAINELRRSQGSRLKWIHDLCRRDQAYTQFFGEQLNVLQPRYTGSDFALTDYQNLTSLRFRETTSGHKNRFRASRLQPGMNTIVGEARGDTYGRNGQTRATISPPSRMITAWVDHIEKGVLTNFTAFDSSNNVVASGNGIFASAIPIAAVEFTFEPLASAFDLDSIQKTFHVYFLGGGRMPTFDTTFNDTVDSSTEQTYYGLREEYTVLEDPIWPDKASATAAATNMARENADLRMVSNWTSWLNPRIRAGKRVSITDWTMRQVATSWMVRQVDHRFTHTSAVMTIGCSRRRA